VRKRTVALLFLGLVAGLVLATLAALRTPWAGERVCRAAVQRVEGATGLRLSFEACSLDVFGLSVEVRGMALSLPEGPPVFEADAVSARLAAIQALGRQVHLQRLTLVRPRVKLDRAETPAAPPGMACPPAFLSRFDIQQLEVHGGTLDLAAAGRRLTLEGIDVSSTPGRRTLRQLAGPGPRTRVEVTTGAARLRLPGRTLDAARLHLAGELERDLSGAEITSAQAELDGARIGLAGKVENLCAPRLDLEATAEGPLASLAALAGTALQAEGTASVALRVKGKPAAPELSARLSTQGVRVGRFTLGDARARLHLEGDQLVVDGLEVAAAGGRLAAHGTVQLARGLPATMEAELSGVDLGEIIDRVGVRRPWITVRLEGKGRLAGTLDPPQLAGELAAALHDFKALTRPYQEGAGDPGILAFERGSVDGRVRVDRRGLYFDGARVQVGRGTLAGDAAIHFSNAGGFWVRSSGTADLSAAGRIAEVPWAGLATVEVSVAAAPYAVPTVEGRAQVAGFRFLDVELGEASADFHFTRPTLQLTAIEGTQASARYRGEAAIDLFARPIELTGASYQLHGRSRDLCDAVLARLPRARVLHDALDAEVELGGAARGPARSPDIDFVAELGAGTVYGRRFDGGRVVGQVAALEEARFGASELRRGDGVVRGSGSWGTTTPFPWSLELSFSHLPVDELELAPGWTGTVGGTALLAGSMVHPRVRLEATATGVAFRQVKLGSARLEATQEGEQVAFSAAAPGVETSGEVTLAGRYPFRAHAALALEDATRLLEGGAPVGLRIRAVGEADADGELEAWREAHVEARLSQLQGSYADLRVEATSAAQLTAAGGRWELLPLRLQGPNTALVVSGAWLPAGELDVAASGAVDLRLLSGLVPTLRRSSGQLAVEARLSGTPQQPLVVGSGKLIDGTFQLKGATATFTGVSGGMAFSHNRVIFDRIDATVNGGKGRFKGELELARLVPVRLRAEGVLEEVPVVVPNLMPATLSGRLEAIGTPESATLTGRLHVVRARYTSDVDLQGSLLRRRAPPLPRTYDRAGEWLRLDVQLVADGDVRVENDLVRGPVSGELTLTGTLAAPGLVGSLAMGRGSKVSFRGNEFDLTHAVLDFTDRSRIEMALDVHGESQVRDYQVFLHVFGSLAEPHLKLTSLPDLPEQDIVTLLSLGFTRRDAGAQAGVSGVATATAAQALLSATGLDEQVRRFLPRGGPIRDLSMRIVTGYSEETGQVEPRAEFESWLLRDRLRLRFQTPLGSGRGRKAQAEVRLGEHTAVQYQWDNESLDVPTGDHGIDLKLRWEWTDER
jgi:translocation and assembly module TamB